MNHIHQDRWLIGWFRFRRFLDVVGRWLQTTLIIIFSDGAFRSSFCFKIRFLIHFLTNYKKHHLGTKLAESIFLLLQPYPPSGLLFLFLVRLPLNGWVFLTNPMILIGCCVISMLLLMIWSLKLLSWPSWNSLTSTALRWILN